MKNSLEEKNFKWKKKKKNYLSFTVGVKLMAYLGKE